MDKKELQEIEEFWLINGNSNEDVVEVKHRACKDIDELITAVEELQAENKQLKDDDLLGWRWRKE